MKSSDKLPGATPTHEVLRTLSRRALAHGFDEAEIACMHDFRHRASYRSGSSKPIAASQRTTSLLFTLRRGSSLLRHSTVDSGWTAADPVWPALDPSGAVEPMQFPLRASTHLPRCPRISGFAKGAIEVASTCEKVARAVARRFPKANFGIHFFHSFDRFVIENTKDLSGSYEHPYLRAEYRLSYRGKDVAGLTFDVSAAAILEDIERRLDRAVLYAKSVQTGFLKEGQLPALLDPKVTALLAQILFEQSKAYSRWPDHYEKVFPLDFVFEDDPTHGIGQNSVPFDHEGTPTERKVLMASGKSARRVCDLQSSALCGTPPSGNGFRRGLFVSHIADLTPGTQPTFLRVFPGKTPLQEIMRDHPQFVYLNQVSFPLDRFSFLVKGQGLVTLEGVYIDHGKVVSNIVMKNHADRPLISGYPRSYGSLVDPSTTILSDGEYTYGGWYPYLFLPRMTWRESD